ncbi:hypothetical protein O3P69_017125 [Scylla paramamosain]|uniref:Ig-like domain-containing protein n=1 Tax=Scylla paramamosain TaxID=85552 RepID=A0AAW0TXA0_SCYPA
MRRGGTGQGGAGRWSASLTAVQLSPNYHKNGGSGSRFASAPGNKATEKVFVLGNQRQVWEVTGVAGRSVDLPCYLRPRTPGDRPKLVLWYKEAHSSPLVSGVHEVWVLRVLVWGIAVKPDHDTRDGLPPGDSALDLSVGLGRGRGEGALRVGRGSATLTYYNVTPQHAGLYECRVDFYTSPAHTNYVNLTVVELPKNVRLLDKEGLSIEEGVLGPYFTGQTVRVECVALGGQPRPKLTWWRNNHILRSGGEEEEGPGRVSILPASQKLEVSADWLVWCPRAVRSELVIESISRAWHNHTLTCTASNTPLASPVPASATISLYLLPRRVEVQTPGHAREGQPALILCTTEGSRPRPTLTLSLGGRRLAPDKERVEGLVSVATVSVNVTRADHGALVACTAENPAVPGSSLTNTTVLDVEYPPSVTASLGRSLQPHLLKEGDDVYFTCSVDANPPAAAVTWYHEGRVQVQNMTSGVILTGESLVLQKVSRRRAGEYRCQATNSFASVTSSPVTLRIRYRPQCLTTPTTYFIYDKPINVTCTVTSHPPAKAVHWQWNSSNDVIKTQLVEATTERVSTQLSVAPIETYEDRLLSCWAVNEMGRQQRACGFSIKVAEMPLPLSSCGLANITASSLSLTCQRPPLAVPGSSTVYRAESRHRMVGVGRGGIAGLLMKYSLLCRRDGPYKAARPCECRAAAAEPGRGGVKCSGDAEAPADGSRHGLRQERNRSLKEFPVLPRLSLEEDRATSLPSTPLHSPTPPPLLPSPSRRLSSLHPTSLPRLHVGDDSRSGLPADVVHFPALPPNEAESE